MLPSHRPWAAHRVVSEEGVSWFTTQGYRRLWTELGEKMEPSRFGVLGRRVAAAEEVTRIILRLMDQSPNVLDASSTEDKP